MIIIMTLLTSVMKRADAGDSTIKTLHAMTSHAAMDRSAILAAAESEVARHFSGSNLFRLSSFKCVCVCACMYASERVGTREFMHVCVCVFVRVFVQKKKVNHNVQCKVRVRQVVACRGQPTRDLPLTLHSTL